MSIKPYRRKEQTTSPAAPIPVGTKSVPANPVQPRKVAKQVEPRTREQKEIDKFEMIRLLRRGWSRSMIAERFGVEVKLIDKDWSEVVRDLKKDRDEDIANLIAIKLQEYAEVKREAWDAWDKSKQDAVQNSTEQTQDQVQPDPRVKPDVVAQKVKKGKVTKRQSGDPRFLEKIINCLAAERELLALNPVKKFEFEGHIVNWDILLQVVPDGGVPDTIEAQLRQYSQENQVAMGLLEEAVKEQEEGAVEDYEGEDS